MARKASIAIKSYYHQIYILFELTGPWSHTISLLLILPSVWNLPSSWLWWLRRLLPVIVTYLQESWHISGWATLWQFYPMSRWSMNQISQQLLSKLKTNKSNVYNLEIVKSAELQTILYSAKVLLLFFIFICSTVWKGGEGDHLYQGHASKPQQRWWQI